MKKTQYFNRELSWLEFNQRVLDQALDISLPLLERLKFIAITASNLDEFFMVRVGGLQIISEEKLSVKDPSGMTPLQQLNAISKRIKSMVELMHKCYTDDIERKLSTAGIRRVKQNELNEYQSQHIEYVFENEIFPVLSPIAIKDIENPPLFKNQILNLCVRLKNNKSNQNNTQYAVIPIGKILDRFITLPSDGGYQFMFIEDVVKIFVHRFFTGSKILECVPFRITRNADLSAREDLSLNMLSEMERIILARKRSHCVRLEIAEGYTKTLLLFISKVFCIKSENIYIVNGPLALSSFFSITEVEGFDSLKLENWPSQASPQIDSRKTMFEMLSSKNILLFHPYENFDPVVRLIEEAADDENVIALKQILYRTSRNSPVVRALSRAAQKGKYVTVVVELKARFDEERNIEWAKELEDAGVQVIYGIKNLKTHGKICLIIRRETHGVKRYIHFGTGNYNEITAKLYSDISYMTSDEDLGADASTFFNAITGYSHPQKFRKIEIAPIRLREAIIELIESETERKKQGQKAIIMAKLNSLVDRDVIDSLYKASSAGVKIRLNIRGICCLKPGIPGLSENISIISIVDRFLEHSRIMYFYQGGQEKVYISSADWMPRNLDKRVELLIPVEDSACAKRLKKILEICFQDNVNAWKLQKSGHYIRLTFKNKNRFRSQEEFYKLACEKDKQQKEMHQIIFEPHKPSS
ncbi:MAG: polyphosphate kinase 1 [Candidatus Theseobacter exili]|nr:polyphosphate kinase 1 [Candidatus Theseobacter exili]